MFSTTYTKKSWSVEEETEMLSSIRQGETLDKIAKQHERTQNAIRLRFGLVCKKELLVKKMPEICREYHMSENQVLQCIQDLEKIQNKNNQTSSLPPPPNLDADITIIKEEILVIKDKLDKMCKYMKKIMENVKK
jgi:LysM repeat protein